MTVFKKEYDLKGIGHDKFIENFHYNPETGKITWIKPRKRVLVGQLAFNTPQSAGYLEGGFMLKRFLAHRVAFFMYHGFITEEIDHINLDRTDNRISNLRASNSQTNSCNMPRRSDNTSGFKGVCFDKRKGLWIVRVHIDKKPKFVGYYSDKELAAAAYRKHAEDAYGEYMRIE